MNKKFLTTRAGRIVTVVAAGALVTGASIGVASSAMADSRGCSSSHSSSHRSQGAIGIVTAPVISGTGAVGQTLTYTPGVWAYTPDSVAFQWFSGEHAIEGANAPTFVITEAQAGRHISVRETATKVGYNNRTVSSNKIQVASLERLIELQDVVITGATTVGSTLTVIPGIYNSATDSVSYQWQRDGANIADATGLTYVVTADDLGKQIRVIETVSAAGYKTSVEASNRMWIPVPA